MVTVRAACPLDCWDTCSWLVSVENGAVTGVRGDPDDPYTRGFVCPKARFQMERHNAPDRPMHPLVKSRGSWRQAGWDEALALLSGKIQDAVERYGPSSVFYYHDAGSMGLSKSLGLRLFRRLGAAEPLGGLCWAAGIKAQEYDFGYHLANSPADVLNSSMAIIWGKNPAATNVHLTPFLKEARQRGTRLVLVDPIRSPSVALVDEHIQLRPATDGALALSMCHVIVEEGLVDVPFVAAYTVGFDAFRQHLAKYTPLWGEKLTGIDREVIASLARRYATGGPATILMGYGFQRHYGGGNAVRACDALAVLTGNVGKAGGGANYANGYIAKSLVSLAGTSNPARPVRRIPRATLGDISSLKDPPVEVMVVSGANPLNQSPGARRTRDALAGIPFKAVLDLRWTETCEDADLFLPVATSFEDRDLHSCSWHDRLTLTDRCVAPRGEALPDRVIWQRLAERLGYGSEFSKTLDEWVDVALERMRAAGLSAKSLSGKTVSFPGMPAVAYQSGVFLTSSGKFEFVSKRAAEETGYPMATYVGPPNGDGNDGGNGAYPLRLLSPRRIDHLHSQFYERVLAPGGLPVAYLSRGDLAAAGMVDGDTARMESAYGAIEVLLKETGDVPPGVALMYEGGSVIDGKGANLLTPQGETDMGHGAVFYDTFVRVVC